MPLPSFLSLGLIAGTLTFLSFSDAQAQQVKLSNGNLCHAVGTEYYDRTQNYTAFNSLEECLDSGGDMPDGRAAPARPAAPSALQTPPHQVVVEPVIPVAPSSPVISHTSIQAVVIPENPERTRRLGLERRSSQKEIKKIPESLSRYSFEGYKDKLVVPSDWLHERMHETWGASSARRLKDPMLGRISSLTPQGWTPKGGDGIAGWLPKDENIACTAALHIEQALSIHSIPLTVSERNEWNIEKEKVCKARF